jgi:DNA-binding MarR family transcriptional regulator
VTSAPPQAGSLPLSALLSQALVAFTIEFDNAAELAIPNRTTWHGHAPPGGGVWLVSMAMWLNCMRYVGTEPITLGEVARRARTGTNLDGMRRWGYVTVDPGPGNSRYTARHEGLVLRATTRGLQARAVWQPLTGVIEQRWRDRFGAAEIGGLRAALQQPAARLGPWLPDSLPILGYGLYSLSKGRREDRYQAAQSASERDGGRAGQPTEDTSTLALPWLLARVLLALAIDYERESELSLAVAANLLRVLDDRGVRVRDLPRRTGVSKEAIAMATGFTGRAGITTTGSDPEGGRWKLVRLTPKGRVARDRYTGRLESVEERWRRGFGDDVIDRLRTSLERLTGPGGPGSPLFAGLDPGPENWRSDVEPPQTLPHFPMVLHRGGYPDGS